MSEECAILTCSLQTMTGAWTAMLKPQPKRQVGFNGCVFLQMPFMSECFGDPHLQAQNSSTFGAWAKAISTQHTTHNTPRQQFPLEKLNPPEQFPAPDRWNLLADCELLTKIILSPQSPGISDSPQLSSQAEPAEVGQKPWTLCQPRDRLEDSGPWPQPVFLEVSGWVVFIREKGWKRIVFEVLSKTI